MVVLRIKEYDNGDVCLEYRMTRKERGMTISNKEISVSSYHYFKLGTFGEKNGMITGASDSGDNEKSFELMKALSEMGENNITDFIIEIAANPNEYLETRIAGVIRLFRLTPEDVLLVRPNFDYFRECC